MKMVGLILVCLAVLAGPAAGAPAPQAEWAVPVLCYHQFGTEKKHNPFKMSAQHFEEQISWLSRSGYHSVSLAQLGQALDGKADLPSKPVCITIDDGFESGWTVAGPVLKKYGFKASYFLQAKLQGRRNMLSWDQVRELEKEGFEAASHTCYHTNLGKPQAKEDVAGYGRRLREEIFESKNILERQLGHPVDWLAYPYGAYNARVEEAVKKAGYRHALTVTPGLNRPGAQPLRLRRLLIMNPVKPATFARQLESQPVPMEMQGMEEGSQWVKGAGHPVRLKFGAGVRPQRVWVGVGPAVVPLKADAEGWTCVIPADTKTGFHFFTVNDMGSVPPRQSQWLFQVIRPEWASYMKEEN